MKIQNILKSLGYEQPDFENINYDWWKENGFDKCIDVNCTYSTRDWKLSEENTDYDTLEDLIELMDKDNPEKGLGLNYRESNDIVMMHDHYHIKHTFLPLLEKIEQKNIEFADFKLHQ